MPNVVDQLVKIINSLADQQAMPDDSWRRELDEVLVQAGNHTRWNIDEEPDGTMIRICRGDHPSAAPCHWVNYRISAE